MATVSILCLECILPYIDVNKRITLSICLPSIRKLDKSIPIHFYDLKIRSSLIKMNGREFRLGEIRISSDADDSFLNTVNSRGGSEWKSLRDAVPEPGDIVLRPMGDPDLLEQDKMEIMQSLRHLFMKAQEKYENSETAYDPFNVLVEFFFLNPMFEKISSPSNSVLSKIFNVSNVMHKMNRVKEEEDELTRMFPKTFKRISKYIEETKSHEDIVTCFLLKLIYPQIIHEHFNQLSVYNYGEPEYPNRLPNGLSLRKAMKQLSTLIFGGRKKISVEKISIDGAGIIPLPVGFKIDRVQSLQQCCRDYRNKYDSIVKHIDSLYVYDIDESISNMLIVHNSRQVEFCSLNRSSAQIVLQLFNEVLVLTIQGESTFYEIVQHFLANENRKIGSKVFMRISSGETLFFQSRLAEIGFRVTPGSSSVYRSLSGGRKAVFDAMKNRDEMCAYFVYPFRLESCFCLKIVED